MLSNSSPVAASQIRRVPSSPSTGQQAPIGAKGHGQQAFNH